MNHPIPILHVIRIRKSRLVVFFVALLSLLAGNALAANQGTSQPLVEEEQWGTRQPTFPELDTNRDGFISKEEAKQWRELTEKFEQIDQNNDHKIDSSELRAFKAQKIKEEIQGFTKPRE